jgi:tryptophan synthase beta chain
MSNAVEDAIARIKGFDGHFGQYGGQYVAETLMPAVTEVDIAFRQAWADPAFHAEYHGYLRDFVGRPSALFFAERLTEALGGAQVWFKREDLNHTGAHKINNTIGQLLLAKRMGKKRIIAETGAGQHGVATATAAAIFGFECEVFMGEEDIRRQAENVKRMRLLGSEVIPVTSGTGTLKDAMNEALRDWVATVDDTFYCIGSVAGPHPYPMMVREFQRVIGDEARQQMLDAAGRLPDTVVACVGGGSNSMGIFAAFLDDKDVALVGVEAAGHGIETGEHAASIRGGEVGVLHGSKTYLLQTDEGQICNAHSISAGLDYPGIGPEHSHLHEIGRVQFEPVTDSEAVKGFLKLTREQGIIPALESSHAVAWVLEHAPQLGKDHILLVNLSGRGDKDLISINEFIEEHGEPT